MSSSLILVEGEKDYWLAYSVSVSAMQQQVPYTTGVLEVCTIRRSDSDSSEDEFRPTCSYEMPFPSTGEALQSEEMFVEIEDISLLLVDDSMRVDLKLLQHDHSWGIEWLSQWS